MNLRRTPTLIGAGILQTVAASIAFADPVYFMGLGDQPGGNFESRPYGISADGTTVIGSSRFGTVNKAFRWTLGTGMTSLGTLPGHTVSTAYGISDDGSVIVGTSGEGGQMRAFRWTIGAGIVGFDSTAREARGISGDGQVIVGSTSTGQGYRWTSTGGMSILPLPPPTSHPCLGALPRAASANGSRIVGNCENDLLLENTVHWNSSGGSSSVIYYAQGIDSLSTDISADGSIAVGTSLQNGVRAYRWTSATGMEILTLPPGIAGSSANGISADGTTIVGAINGAQSGPLIWTSATGMRFLTDVLVSDYGLNLSGWTLGQAWAVSANGSTIVGEGTNPNGTRESWVAHIPEPSTLSLLVLGGTAVLHRRRRAR